MTRPLDMFGAEEATETIMLGEKIARAALPAVVGGLAALIARKSHPILAFLGVSALVGNTQEVIRGERSIKDASLRMGRHVVASAASLASPTYPVIAYVAGAFAADLILDRDGKDGILDDWGRYVGVDIDKKTATEAKKESTAIVVTEKK